MNRDDRVRAAIALRSIEGVGDRMFHRLVARFGGPSGVFAAGAKRLRAEKVDENLAASIERFDAWSEVDREIRRAHEAGAEVFVHDDCDYPFALRHIFDPPPVLYVRGQITWADVLAISVVGSRNASPYGLAAADTFGRDLAAAAITVVSGLAVGIDSAAHRGALAAGGRTIAVLGSGIDRVYPERHRRLADEIAGHGAVVSEFPTRTRPEKGNFPRRNRIVSGLSLGTVVVEASERSGSLITARLAAEQGREVFAVPGEINTPRTRGTHRLLREGASLAEGAAEVIEGAAPWVLEMRTKNRQTGRFSGRLAPELETILDAFERPVMHVNELIERCALGASRALEALLALELRGFVAKHPGMFYSRRPR